MLTAPLLLVLELPPLAFGPTLPPAAFTAPRELTCAVSELGRPRALKLPAGLDSRSFLVDPGSLRPRVDRHLVNPVVDGLLVLGALAATRGGWDERTWGLRTWGNLGAVTPVPVPPLPTPPSAPPR